MHWLDWIIVAVPLLVVFGIAFYSRRYVRSVADFLAAGRVAGRYVISVGDMSAALSVITVISLVESQYQSGLGITFWNNLLIPVTIFLISSMVLMHTFSQQFSSRLPGTQTCTFQSSSTNSLQPASRCSWSGFRGRNANLSGCLSTLFILWKRCLLLRAVIQLLSALKLK